MIKDGNDSLALVYPVRGRIRYSQRNDVTLGAGEPVLIDTSVPGELGARSACHYISLVFSPAMLPAALDRKRLENRRWPRDAPALRLLRAYVETLAGSSISPVSELAETAQRQVFDLVRLAATECSGLDQRDLLKSGAIGDARVRVALGEIEKSFRDPHLTEVEIAARQGITPRHLQRLFERAGLRFTECVNEVRLAAAHRALRDPRLKTCSVMQVAMDAGYSDVTHFNRVFKRHFGITPSEVRGGGTNERRGAGYRNE